MSHEIEKSQKAFLQSILSGHFDPDFMEQMIPLGKLNPLKAMNIYRGDYTARMQEALGDIYEATWTVLGDETFTQLSQDFIAKNNSSSYNLGDYGQNFPEFIKEHSANKEIPFLFDLTHFEREFMKVFHASFQKALGPENFQKLESPFALKLHLGQKHFLFKSQFPIKKIWEARNAESEPDLDWSQGESLLVFKGRDNVSLKTLTPFQFHIIEELNKEMTLEESLTNASQKVESLDENEISAIFSFLTTEGLITDVR